MYSRTARLSRKKATAPVSAWTSAPRGLLLGVKVVGHMLVFTGCGGLVVRLGVVRKVRLIWLAVQQGAVGARDLVVDVRTVEGEGVTGFRHGY